jgi:endonuclease/exonuclease/phosphatase family metal-dependent hydrolase
MAQERVYFLKIIQVNGWLGYLIHPLLQFIESEQPDIICMQEVLSSDFNIPLFNNFQLLQHTAKAGMFNDYFFSPTHTFESMKTKIDLGNAIFSKYPITNKQTVFINGEYNRDDSVHDFKYNIRNLQICEINLDSKKLHIANHHGFHDLNHLGNGQTVECIDKVASSLKSLGSPIVFCGDLNITTDSPAFAPLDNLGYKNLTKESNIKTTLSSVHRADIRNKVACDYVFTSTDIKIINFGVSDTLVSDHKALILEFEI